MSERIRHPTRVVLIFADGSTVTAEVGYFSVTCPPRQFDPTRLPEKRVPLAEQDYPIEIRGSIKGAQVRDVLEEGGA